MQNSVIRSQAAAILLLISVMFSWGCGSEQQKASTTEQGGVAASVIAEIPAVDFTAPAAPSLSSSEIVAYIKVREPQKFIDRLGSWSSLFPMPMTPEMLRTQLEQSGINLSELREDGNIAFFVFNPGPAFANVPMAGLVPAADGGSIAQSMRVQLSDANVQALGESLLFAQDIDTLTRAQALGDSLRQTADASMASDVQLYLNMDTIMKQYGAMARGYIPMLQGFVAMSGLPQDQVARTEQNMGAGLTALLDFFDQLQGVTLLVDLAADELEVAAVVTAKPESVLFGMLNAEPVAAPDLARFLPGDDILRAQVTYSDMMGMMDWSMKFMENMVPPNSGVDFAKVKEEFASISEIGRTDYAFGAGLQEDGSMGIQGIMRMEDTAPMMKFIGEKMGSFNEGVIHDFYKASGMDMSIEELDTRQVAGYPVHQYKVSMNFDPSMAVTPEQTEMMQKIMGNMQMEIIEIKPLIVYSINKPLDATVQALIDGQAGASLSAMKSYPAGGIFYGDVNFAAYLNAVQKIIPELQASGMPVLPANLPPMMMNGRNAKGDGYYSVKIPRGLVKGFVDAATGIAQQPQAMPSAPPVPEPATVPGA